tara:strand:+ start:14 stop:988 length:975 start_codon:yes stop_codon:yes gene_type:complete
MKVKKILIISLGSIGKRHLKIIKKIRPEIKVNLLRRKIPIKKSKDEELINKTFNNLKEALKDGVDAAIIASPSRFHIEHSLELLKANIPILIEKPISDSLKRCFKLNELAKKKNNLITVGYVLRHSKILNEFKNILKENHIGNNLYAEIKCGSYLPNWREDRDYRDTVSANSFLGGGVLLELSHEINYANWLFGPFKDCKSISINTKQLDIDVEDITKIIAVNNNNFLVHIHLDFCSNSNERYCKLFGTLGYLKLDFNSQLITIKKNNSEKFIKIQLDEKYNDMYINQTNHFLDCIENNKEPIVTIDDAIETLKLITECNRTKL